MKNLVCVVFSLVILSVASLGNQLPLQPKIQILRIGEFHANEVFAKSGEVWYGLYPSEDGYELIASKITVEPIHDHLVDEYSEQTGKRVSVDQPAEPVLLIRGLESLQDGRVKTVFSGKKFLYPGESVSLKFDEGDYYGLAAFGLAADRGVARPFDMVIYNYKIMISHIPWTKSQVVASFDIVALDGTPTLLWAGDLDRDGKLDLLMDLTDHYNVSAYTLFLSSMAEEGALLRKVAVFRSVGC